MKFFIAVLALAATAIASSLSEDGAKICGEDQTVVCSGNGVGKLISLGSVGEGIAGESCSPGNIYCCSKKYVSEFGLVDVGLNLQCTLNRVG
ncbi:uncharacterized protein N7498_000601 [Penicillium cinerascens]|uniref:Hydrophobin n=1 Tax=Penicillium cinerascens TaxID=70096 RepID=A0A9W9NEN4_9EURO|nr:uncharacterized protein N7498_000601 [Penicillium cinerascens]KAJ5218502.1 hypothetical protein N7498_000601 [Penicillium cinerascens]